MPQKAAQAKLAPYSRLSQGFHWISALLVFAIVPIGLYMADLPKTDPTRAGWFALHKSLGITILALTVGRAVWRHLAPPPPLNGLLPALQERIAKIEYMFLYLLLLFMPVTGYVMSAAGNHPVGFFGLFTLPNLVPVSEPLAEGAEFVHVSSQYGLYALLVLHIGAVAFHGIVKRDGLAGRMIRGG